VPSTASKASKLSDSIRQIERLLQAYPPDCQPQQIEPLAAAGGFSGSRIWRLQTPRGPLGLRRWPEGSTPAERLQFIHAVLWYAQQEGYSLVPVPLEARNRKGFLEHGGCFWQLEPWMPGEASYHDHPSRAKLKAAMIALAEFHEATSQFPLPHWDPTFSPGIRARLEQLQRLVGGDAAILTQLARDHHWSELRQRGERLATGFAAAAPHVRASLRHAAAHEIRVQPCIRDVWHDHILFEADAVSGIIDFGAMRVDNVACDVARLLGSLVGDDPTQWKVGLAAYASVRPLGDLEQRLIRAFDESTVLLSGFNWLDWICRQGRVFSDPQAVLARIDGIGQRLDALVGGQSAWR